MARTNAINNKSQELTIDPGASGDSFLQFDINTTGEFRIGADDTDDSFRISQGSALGTSDTFIMTANGERTMPLQPAFYAHLSVDNTDVTGDGTTFGLEFDTEIFDQNGDYDNTTDIFTAPVTGRYYFQMCVQPLAIATSSFTTQFFQIVTSNRTHTSIISNPFALQRGTNLKFTYSSFCDMDALDTATVTYTASGSTKTVDINAGLTSTVFSGYLVC